MEVIQQFGPNVIRCQLSKGVLQWYIIGCYLAPENALTINIVVAALKERPQGSKLLVVGYFNDYLEKPEGAECDEENMPALEAAGL